MRKALTVAAVLLWATGAAAQPSPTSVRLVAQAQADLAGAARDLWPGWDQTPFGVLLIEDEREHLICHPTNPPGFSPPVRHAALGCNVQSRARVFPRGLLAAMPAFGLPATVVVGAPAATGKSDTAWRATLLHEHFHQHQWTFPRYGERTAALGLSGGDGTGMWMLNYAFPYAQPGVAGRFAEAASILERALASEQDARRGLRAYLAARAALAGSVQPRDWRYLELQLWQEGVARWTEIEAARRASDPELRRHAAALRADVLRELAAADLAKNKRVALYALGAGEAMLLERCRSRWRERYPAVLATGPLLNAALEDCRP